MNNKNRVNSPDNKRAELSQKINTSTNNREDTIDNRSEDTAPQLQNNPDLKTKGESQQRRKCSECGRTYLGQEHSSTCSDKCRKRKQRK